MREILKVIVIIERGFPISLNTNERPAMAVNTIGYVTPLLLTLMTVGISLNKEI